MKSYELVFWLIKVKYFVFNFVSLASLGKKYHNSFVMASVIYFLLLTY